MFRVFKSESSVYCKDSSLVVRDDWFVYTSFATVSYFINENYRFETFLMTLKP